MTDILYEVLTILSSWDEMTCKQIYQALSGTPPMRELQDALGSLWDMHDIDCEWGDDVNETTFVIRKSGQETLMQRPKINNVENS